MHFRSHLLDVLVDEDVLPTLNGIVGSTGPLLTCSDPLQMTDKIVELTLAYMEQIPPASLIESCGRQTCTSPPIWATAAVAPTDYAVLKHSKELRGSTSEAEPINDAAAPSIDQVVNEQNDTDKSDIIAAENSHVSTVDRFPQAAVAAGIVPITRQSDENLKPRQARSNGALLLALLFLMAAVVFVIANGWIVDGSGKYWGSRQVAREVLQESRGSEAKPSLSSLGSIGVFDADSAPKVEQEQGKPVSARPATVAKTSQDSKNRGETNGELDSQKKVPGRRVPFGSAGEAELEALEEVIFSKDALLLAQRNLERVSRQANTPDSSAGESDVVDGREFSGESSADQDSLPVVEKENPVAGVGEDQKGQNQDQKAIEQQPAGETAGVEQTRLSKEEDQGRQVKGGDNEATNSPEQRSPQDDTKVDPSTAHDKQTSKKNQGRKDAERLAQSTSEQAKQAKEQARLMVAQLRGEDANDASASQSDGGSKEKDEDSKQQNKSTQSEAMQQDPTPEAVLAKNYKLVEKLSRVWVDPNIESVEQEETLGQKDPLHKKVAQGLATYWKRIRSKA